MSLSQWPPLPDPGSAAGPPHSHRVLADRGSSRGWDILRMPEWLICLKCTCWHQTMLSLLF